ncbi:MAG: hypothetical protein ABSE71_02715 [Candidatus Micrarchaeaceae archaeon]
MVFAFAMLKSMTFGTFLRKSETIIAEAAVAGVVLGVAAEETRKLLRNGK